MPGWNGEPIALDLRKLTQAHIDEAMPNMEGCTYQGPCIIGTLIPKEKRAAVDESAEWWDGHIGSDNVDILVTRRVLAFPDNQQVTLASDLQAAFDVGDVAKFQDAITNINQTLGLNLKVNYEPTA